MSGAIFFASISMGASNCCFDSFGSQLAAQLEVECEPSASIDQIVVAYLNASRQNSRDDVNLKAFEILNQIRDAEGHLPVPEPLRKLGNIRPLRLFLSTTIDSLLTNALGSPANHVFAYSPNATAADIPRDYVRSPHRVVFHLFGRISGSLDSALIDEETLDSSGNSTKSPCPRASPTSSTNCVTNACFSWATPTRIGSRGSLSVSPVATGSTARQRMRANLSPTEQSLRTPICATFWKISAHRPIVWCGESYRVRGPCREERDAFPDKPSAARPGVSPGPATVKPPAVFVSYASQDREAVERLHASFSVEGFDVWFDKGRLESGDPWWPVIDQNIATCDVFVAIISANTNKREGGISFANGTARWTGSGTWTRSTARLVHPVIVDDTAEGASPYRLSRVPLCSRKRWSAPEGFRWDTQAIVRERRLKAASQ